MKITVQNRYLAGAGLVLALFDLGLSLSNNIKAKELDKNIQEINIARDKEVMIKPLVDPSIIEAMIEVESGGDEKAYNKYTGAVGILQLRPIIYGKLCGLTKEQAFERSRNIACATLFFSELLKQHKGNIEATLLHYNNGLRISNYNYSKKVLAKRKSLTKKH